MYERKLNKKLKKLPYTKVKKLRKMRVRGLKYYGINYNPF